ncbi:MAG: hypothetical protein GF349_04955 [Candidatus Magasanikbacteria bacterium]|nr:hypothetical protein [Candidatus Magasanikbacteria bacterium]
MSKISKKYIKYIKKLKKSYKKHRHENLIKPFLAGLVTIMFLTTVIMPQAVNTKTNEVIAAFSDYNTGSFISIEQKSFPVSEKRKPKRVMWVVVTAYSSDVAQTDSTPCIPANGYNLCDHYEKYGSGNSIAANFLSFDTQVKLPEVFGDKIFVVRDRMNARYNGQARIDVWMPTREEAVQFGVKTLKMEIY